MFSEPAKTSGEKNLLKREKFGQLPDKWTADNVLVMAGMATLMMMVVMLLLYCSYKQSSQVS